MSGFRGGRGQSGMAEAENMLGDEASLQAWDGSPLQAAMSSRSAHSGEAMGMGERRYS